MELRNEFVVSTGVDEAWRLLTDVERIAPCMPGAELQEIEGDEYRGVVKVKLGPIVAQYRGKATFVERDDANHKAVLRAEGRDVRGQGNASATITATLTSEAEGTRVNVLTDLTITGKAAQFGRGVLADVSARLLNQFVSCLESQVLAGVTAPATAESGAKAGAAAPAGASDAGPALAGTQEAPGGDGAGATPATLEAPPPAPPASPGPTAPAAPPSPARAPEPAPPAPSAPAGPRAVSYRPAEPVDLLGTAGAPLVKRLVPALLGVVLLWLVRRKLRGRA